MSRIGKAPVTVPAGVAVTIAEGNKVTVKGAKGELSRVFSTDMKITMEDGKIKVERGSDEKEQRALHGLTRTLINNMVVGVSAGFEKELHLVGVGYKIVPYKGKGIEISCGFSHTVPIEPIEGISFEIATEKGLVKLKIKGIDKEQIGQIAADIRDLRRPEPYKGKGFRYSDEVIIKKLGKAGKTGK
ncbi:MAG: 50S ribosomal protein L6 [bacterium]|nr:50S ribosomal protein L6 [bacterium]